MTGNEQDRPPRPVRDVRPLVPAILWVVVFGLLLAAGVYTFRSMRKLPSELLDQTGSAIHKVRNAPVDELSTFRQRTVTNSFFSYATSLSASQFLQFSTLRQTEVFTQTDSASTGFGHIPLPDVVVEARAPVEYTYYLDLNAQWDLILRDGVIYVYAPAIRFNKPAVDVSKIEYEIKKGSVFRSGAQARENLQKSITYFAQIRARDNIALVRETGRRQTAEFVEKWLAKSFSDGAKYRVKVFFPGEAIPSPTGPDGVKSAAEQGLLDRK